MEYTAWEQSQHHYNTTDLVDPWDSTKPFETDPFSGYDELDPHDPAPPPHARPADDSFADYHREDAENSFFYDDPSMHVPQGMARPDFIGPGDLHSAMREPSVFDDVDAAGRGHKRELSEAFTMRYPLVSPSHNAPYAHPGSKSAIHATTDASPDLSATMMRTPVREFGSYPFEAARFHDSPSYAAGAGLESPLESLALQSPYMACQPFPALPRVQEHQGPLEDEGMRQLGSAAQSPLNKTRQQRQPRRRQDQKQVQQEQNDQNDQQNHEQNEQDQQNDHHHGHHHDEQDDVEAQQGQVAHEDLHDEDAEEKQQLQADDDSTNSPQGSLSAASDRKSGLASTRGSQSSSASLSSTVSGFEDQAQAQAQAKANAGDATPDRGPQTPRASSAASAKTKPRSRRTPSSVTPKAGAAAQANTPTPTPAQEGRRDSRKRIAKEQIEILEAFFHRNPRPEREDRLRLSSETTLEPRTVQIWFQNRRAKSRSMKMPPSQADNSVFAQQYRAAAAAASNAAAAAAGSQPMMGMGPQGPMSMDRTPSHGDSSWTLTPTQQRMLPSPAAARHTPGYGVFQPQQRVYAGQGSPPPHGQSLGRYHQQLGGGKPMYPGGPQNMQGTPMQFHNVSPMHHQHQHHHPMHPAQGMVPNEGPGPQLMPAMPPPRNMGHGRSMSAYEPFVTNYGFVPSDGSDADGPTDASMMYASKSGSAASLNSMGSSYGLPQSPLNSELVMDGPPPTYSPSMQRLQSSPDLNSSVTSFPPFISSGRTNSMADEPVQLMRSQSAHSFGDAWPRTGAPPMGEMKRRRSLYGAVPTWGWSDHNSGPYMHTSPPRTSSLSSTSSSAGSSAGTLAASAAAAALRTRNRSSTQPAPRSRQPSIRLQLDESNHSATLVVLPQEGESSRRGSPDARSAASSRMSPRASNDRLSSSREMSPERAERAAERLLAERAAAATMGSRPPTRSS